MRKIILLLSLFSTTLLAQTEYVLSDSRVYDFLERMETLHLINKYNSYEIPKTRNEIAKYLKEVIANQNKLDNVDKNILVDLEKEFELELFGTLKNSDKLITGDHFDFLSQKEKYLYFVRDTTNNINLFFNSAGHADGIMGNYLDPSKTIAADVMSYQFQIRGTFYSKFGFFWRGGDGVVFGQREAALFRSDLQHNFKYNTFDKPNSFDITTAGYLTADFGLVKIKFGRDRMHIGYGALPVIMDDNSNIFDYLYLSAKYKSVEVSYFHGKLIGNTTSIFDSTLGSINTVTEKNIGYHRIGLNLSNDFNIGAGEIIIYNSRPVDFTYLNPFNIYKTAQNEASKDRDNSMIIFDFNNKSIVGLKIYGVFLIDDVELAQLGTDYWGNQFIYNFGFISDNLYKNIPLQFQFEYVRQDPYVFTHRLPNNNYTNNGYSIGTFMQPNSELFLTQFNYRFTSRLKLTANFSYYLHGANLLNPDGTVKKNVGGDINLGHRQFDPINAPFLDGDRETTRRFSAKLFYEPIKDVYFSGTLTYLNESLQNSVKNKRFETFLSFGFVL